MKAGNWKIEVLCLIYSLKTKHQIYMASYSLTVPPLNLTLTFLILPFSFSSHHWAYECYARRGWLKPTNQL